MPPIPVAWKSSTALLGSRTPPVHTVDPHPKLDDATPSLHPLIADFLATTSCSLPLPRLGTLILVGPPLGFLPLHRGTRFPRSAQEPGPRSRRLHAGRHPSSRQAPARAAPGVASRPGFGAINRLSTRHQRFTRVRLRGPYLTRSRRAFFLNAHHHGF